jgi:hypothetical protein
MEDRRRVWPGLLAWGLLTGALLLLSYFALTGFLAYRDLQSVRSELLDARAIATTSPGHAQQSVQNAAASAQAASDRLDGPLWGALAGIPVVGDSPAAAQDLTEALTGALRGLEPLVDDMDLLLASALVQGGTVDAAVVDVAAPAARDALPALAAARERLQAAPRGRAVLPQLRAANAELQAQLVQVEGLLAGVAALQE